MLSKRSVVAPFSASKREREAHSAQILYLSRNELATLSSLKGRTTVPLLQKLESGASNAPESGADERRHKRPLVHLRPAVWSRPVSPTNGLGTPARLRDGSSFVAGSGSLGAGGGAHLPGPGSGDGSQVESSSSGIPGVDFGCDVQDASSCSLYRNASWLGVSAALRKLIVDGRDGSSIDCRLNACEAHVDICVVAGRLQLDELGVNHELFSLHVLADCSGDGVGRDGLQLNGLGVHCVGCGCCACDVNRSEVETKCLW